ncbi:MAG: hypothetical protein ABH828_01000 [archaeon]
MKKEIPYLDKITEEMYNVVNKSPVRFSELDKEKIKGIGFKTSSSAFGEDKYDHKIFFLDLYYSKENINYINPNINTEEIKVGYKSAFTVYPYESIKNGLLTLVTLGLADLFNQNKVFKEMQARRVFPSLNELNITVKPETEVIPLYENEFREIQKSILPPNVHCLQRDYSCIHNILK